MERWKQTAAAMVVSTIILASAPVPAGASNAVESLLYGAAAMVYVTRYVTQLDDQGQMQYLGDCQQQTGVYDSPEAQDRLSGIYGTLKSSGDIKRDYEIYAAPSEDINAFMSLGGVMCVYKGTLDSMDDSQLAYVMAHELVHGEKRHSVSGLKKQVGLSTAINIYLSSNPTIGAAVLSNIGANYVSNAVFTMDQEKEADDLGFKYLTDAGYNPGAAAASMQVLYDRYGENSPSGLKAIIQPGNHPATSDRIKKNVKRMYEYSGKHVDVKAGWVVVNGVKTFQPQAAGQYTKEERTYLTAGKLARLYHDQGKADSPMYSGGTVYCGDTALYSVGAEEDGAAIAAALNKGMEKR